MSAGHEPPWALGAQHGPCPSCGRCKCCGQPAQAQPFAPQVMPAQPVQPPFKIGDFPPPFGEQWGATITGFVGPQNAACGGGIPQGEFFTTTIGGAS